MQIVAVLFKLFLEVLEKVDFLLVFDVVPVHVSELEHLSAPDDLGNRFLQELKFFDWVLFNSLEHLDLGGDDRSQPFRMFLRFLMVNVSFKVEHVPRQLMLGIFLFLFFFLQVLVCLLLLFVLITLVVATRGLAMVLPVAHAKPAKLVRAHLARHVVAPLVLFDGFLALRTTLCIG